MSTFGRRTVRGNTVTADAAFNFDQVCEVLNLGDLRK